MSKPTYAEQRERDQEYNRSEALRQAVAFAAAHHSHEELSEDSLVRIADKFYQFVLNGTPAKEQA